MSMKMPLSRRQFLKILAFGGASGLLLLRFNGNWLKAAYWDQPDIVNETRFLMGGITNLILAMDDPILAKKAALAALDEMQNKAKNFDRFDPTSQLSQLNSQGMLCQADPALVALLQNAEQISCASNGAFDVTIKPLFELFQASQGGNFPSRDDIYNTLERVDYTQVVLGDRDIGFSRPGMSLTLDGIAKGAVVDCGVSVLKSHGIKNGIVEAGGDLFAFGTHDVYTSWKVGLRSPRQNLTHPMPILKIHDKAVATSGDYLQAFSQNLSVHHILDPRNGISSPELASVTVIADNAALADALATVIMVVGAHEGLALLKTHPGCEGYFVDKEAKRILSPGMAKYLL